MDRAGSDGLLRVVYEGTAGTLRASTLADPPRIVLDVARPVDPGAREGREQLTPLKTIVLDAGHGGHDSGATGPTGLMEKDLVLDVTRRVAKLVVAQLGMKVLLTRDSDNFVTLRDARATRTSRRRSVRLDPRERLSRSCHDGVETYFLSSEATDSAARQVAAPENGVVQLEQPTGGHRWTSWGDPLTWPIRVPGRVLARPRLSTTDDANPENLNRGVKQAGFYVLGGDAGRPVEDRPRTLGCRKPADTKYRDEIARAIFSGLPSTSAWGAGIGRDPDGDEPDSAMARPDGRAPTSFARHDYGTTSFIRRAVPGRAPREGHLQRPVDIRRRPSKSRARAG